MADNTPLNPGSGGDAIRDIDRSLNTVPIPAKTQVAHLDVGGENVEQLVSMLQPLPNKDFSVSELLRQILIELRVLNRIEREAAGLRTLADDLDAMRADEDADLKLTKGL